MERNDVVSLFQINYMVFDGLVDDTLTVVEMIFFDQSMDHQWILI